MLLLVSLLLVLVSFVLIWTWGYGYYAKNDKTTKIVINAVPVDSASITNYIRDSLQQVYTTTLKDLDVQLDSTLIHTDSLRTELDLKLAEFYRLRNEIAVLLNKRFVNNNFSVAKQKITELQIKAADLKSKNDDVEKENRKLDEVLRQIKDPERTVDNNNKPANTAKISTEENANPVYQLFAVSDMRLSAIQVADDTETETSEAGKTVKFNGALSVVNFNSQVSNAEIAIIILKPDGKVLKNSGWDSGTFNTPDGKKIYSYKIVFDYAKGESKRLSFSVRSGTLPIGKYTMEIYHNGSLIGLTSKTLS